ncbi:OmpA family protein [Roseivivax isoporae]|uniref:OmpA-like domain-containing protein n=1 Tax=Roseivivax isoporae LMG 25204 TaxID=1449351 RepID=X7FDA0_9RHOB|nr:OmpA family protein [Roseivivax isoporae]ETX30031.1 hypothetical protein RISW2_20225 [Roseivivax isoporae LMG 25204]
MTLIKGILAATAAFATLSAPAIAQEAGQCGVYVFFNSGQRTLGADASAILAEYARSNPGAQISVTGYADAPGSATTNQAVSLERAQAVAAALGGTNVVSVTGAGEAVRPGTSGPNDPANRRVEALKQGCTGPVTAMDNTGLIAAAGIGALALGAALAGDDDDDNDGTGTTTTTSSTTN